ncbi:MAG: hypothetical protein II502_03505 [Paludibacteraceae bacterium]|nr:hypothetical protein [Paludibacteraceae bacterium]
MATYTITLNDNSKNNKALLTYLQQLGVRIQKIGQKRTTGLQKSLEDIDAGRVYEAKDMDDLITQLKA